jgi:hypothetical protein
MLKKRVEMTSGLSYAHTETYQIENWVVLQVVRIPKVVSTGPQVLAINRNNLGMIPRNV